MSNEYRTHSTRNHDLLEKNKLLPSYDPTLVQKMIHESQVLENQIRRFMIETEPKSFTIKNMKGQTAFWEIIFTQPVIQYVPQCFRFLTKNIFYYAKAGTWAEYVPSYILNLNHVSLLVNYNKRNPEFISNSDGILKEHVLDGGKKMNMSSLNLLLKGSYKMKTLNQKTHSVIKSSFEFCYWNLPTPMNLGEASCINNLIYSRSSKIFDVLMTRKTLVKILKIEKRKEKRMILENEISVHYAQVLILSDDGNKIKSEKMTVLLTEEIADSVNDGDIFNAVLASTVGPGNKTGRPFVIGKIGKTITPNNMHSVISIVFWKMLQELEDGSSLTKIGTMNQIKTEVTKILQSNNAMFSSENFSIDMLGWTKDLPKKISQCVEDLFPLFFEDNENVYQLSSVLLGFVVSNSPDELDNKKYLLHFAKMFDTIKINSNQWGHDAIRELRNSAPYESIQSSTKITTEKILKNFPRLQNRMVYSRIFSQHYTHW